MRFCHAPIQWLMHTPIPELLPLPPLPPEIESNSTFSLAPSHHIDDTTTSGGENNTQTPPIPSNQNMQDLDLDAPYTNNFTTRDNHHTTNLINDRRESEKKMMRTQVQKRRIVKPVTKSAVVPRRTTNKFKQLREARQEARGFSVDRKPEPPVYGNTSLHTNI